MGTVAFYKILARPLVPDLAMQMDLLFYCQVQPNTQLSAATLHTWQRACHRKKRRIVAVNAKGDGEMEGKTKNLTLLMKITIIAAKG